ncbi:MAG: hypothetical protein COZ06_05710 [Armatimonadetes bacterium CG_4_10_14_3_um_filter_66_18]|nr:MAG: hypothetical protein COZ06_05710 [Armatimonadetes bacterium CG_4_10_14_3_um_filter_66_18]
MGARVRRPARQRPAALQTQRRHPLLGMNDGSYRAYDEGIGKAYEDPMRDIATRLKAVGATVVVGLPGAVDTKYFRNDPNQATVYNDNLAHLRDLAKQVAADNGMPFANVHDVMVEAMTKGKAALGDDYDVCGRDGVHPRPNGHIVMAYAFLEAMGFDGDLGTITVDLKGDSAATAGHKVLSAKDGTVELESSRYRSASTATGRARAPGQSHQNERRCSCL